MTTLSALPNEILHHICADLPATARAQLSGVSTRYRDIANDELGWEKLYRCDAGPHAYKAAKCSAKRTWKQRYGDIHRTVQSPHLTPPDIAQPGDIVTVIGVSQARGEDAPCLVLSRAPLGLMRVRPLPSPEIHGKPRTFMVRARHCRDGTKPWLVPAPAYCFKNCEDLGPNDIGEITADLPMRMILTTALRPGDKVQVHRIALGLSGMPYFMVEEPVRGRTIQDLVAIHIAEQRRKACNAAPKPSMMFRLSAGMTDLGQNAPRPRP